MAIAVYAAGDDTLEAVTDHAPRKGSTNLSGHVAKAGARRSEVGTSGQLQETVASTASSLKPDFDADSQGSRSGARTASAAGASQTAWRTRETAAPHVLLERPLT